MAANNDNSRLEKARATSAELVDALEEGAAPIDGCLMKAMRLARLMRDSDAQTLLKFETSGYPSGFSFQSLASCEQYARLGRVNADGKVAEMREGEHSPPHGSGLSEQAFSTRTGPRSQVTSPAPSESPLTVSGAGSSTETCGLSSRSTRARAAGYPALELRALSWGEDHLGRTRGLDSDSTSVALERRREGARIVSSRSRGSR